VCGGHVTADWTLVCCRSGRGVDAMLREKLRAFAHQRRRFGYRRLHIMLW
jgi:hypothetical protein